LILTNLQAAKFMNPEWGVLFKHAVTEVEGLGLQISLDTGPGWTCSGGPSVGPELTSSTRLRWTIAERPSRPDGEMAFA
jgi:hypothetical protein